MYLTVKFPTDGLPCNYLRKVVLFVITLELFKCEELVCPRFDAKLYANRNVCYWYIPGSFNYTQAKGNCEDDNGHLATLYDLPTSKFVATYVFGGYCQTAHLGITRNPEGVWVTWDNVIISWSNWARTPRQHPSGPGNCVRFGRGCFWRNRDCSTERLGALCESEGIHVTTIASPREVSESTSVSNISTQTEIDQRGPPKSSFLDGSTTEPSVISTDSFSETCSHDISTSQVKVTQLSTSEDAELTTLVPAATVLQASQGTSSATFIGVSEGMSSILVSTYGYLGTGDLQRSTTVNITQPGTERERSSIMRYLAPRIKCQKTNERGTNFSGQDKSQLIPKLNKKNMNKDRRRYYSAADGRASSTAIGVLGVLVICAICCSFLGLDIATVIIQRKRRHVL